MLKFISLVIALAGIISYTLLILSKFYSEVKHGYCRPIPFSQAISLGIAWSLVYFFIFKS